MKNKIVSVLLAFTLCISLAPSAALPVMAKGGISISDAEDFFTLAKKCTLDTYSNGLTVTLENDIDFSGKDFIPIPTFGGVFNGNGHTVKGITFKQKGSYCGVFRYIQEGGTVTGLTVKGKFIPEGTKNTVSGICGENSGTIESCAFSGTVKGANTVGVVCGHNTSSGRIVSCSAYGNVSGENNTGGICGKNNGFVSGCTNNATVNTVYEEKKSDLSAIDTDADAIIENYKSYEDESRNESVLGHTDTGGIAGYSDGIIQGCTNKAAVGYTHIGYNVGGICGRQSGYLIGCENLGFIQGRKDVGGICGQAEPYIILTAEENKLKLIRSRLDTLNSSVNRFITDADNLGSDAEQYLAEISDFSKAAGDQTESLLELGTDFIDDNIAQINAEAAVISNTIDKLIPVFDRITDGCDDLSAALSGISKALSDLNLYAPDLTDEADAISSSLNEISKAERSIKKASSKLDRAQKNLDEAIKFKNSSKIEKAISSIESSIDEISGAKEDIQNAAEDISDLLSEKPEDFEELGLNARALAGYIKTIAEALGDEASALSTIAKSVGTVTANTKIDFDEFKSAAKNISSALGYIGDAAERITGGLGDLADALKNFSDSFYDYSQDISKELNNAADAFSVSFNSLSYATDDLHDAFSDIKTILTDLSNEDTLEFVKLGDEFKNTGENLFNSLSGIGNSLDSLRASLSGGREKLSSDLTSISGQFNSIMELMIGEIEDLTDTDRLSDVFLDASDENIESLRQGKTADCKNHGEINADRNVGGICGAMAIEYSVDPEDDIEKPDSLRFTYLTKAVLQACVNEGPVIGKKDAVGGICGMAEVGTVYMCESYADIESTSGNYVGGICGKCDSSVRKCYAKGKLTGKRFIGGIAGYGNRVTANCSIVTVTGDESAGAVLGEAKELSLVYKNYYAEDALGAVDGISYSQKAEPASFDFLKKLPSVPAEFISFTVTFTAEGETVDTMSVKYGDPTAKIKYPDIPEKKGCFGKWARPESEFVKEDIVIECEYTPYIKVLSSDEKNASGKLALVLAEGEFTDEASLRAKGSAKTAPAGITGSFKVYDVSLSGTSLSESDSITLRFLNENKDKVSVKILSDDGTWQKADVSQRGKYVIFNVTGPKNTLCIKYEPQSHTLSLIVFPLLLLAIVPSFIIIIKKRKKTK